MKSVRALAVVVALLLVACAGKDRKEQTLPMPVTRPPAMSGATLGRTDAMYSYDKPWKP